MYEMVMEKQTLPCLTQLGTYLLQKFSPRRRKRLDSGLHMLTFSPFHILKEFRLVYI